VEKGHGCDGYSYGSIKYSFTSPSCLQTNYRVILFNKFKETQENDILLDGTGPSAIERRHISESTSDTGNIPAAIVSTASQPNQPAATSAPTGQRRLSLPDNKKAHSKHKKNKRIVRLDSEHTIPNVTDDEVPVPPEEEDRKSPDNNNRRVLRYTELEADSRARSPKPSGNRRKTRKAPVAIDVPPVTGDEYRRKIEAMRNEAGSGWLRVLNEMEDSAKHS
jgi:hypothetical protein